MSSDNGKMLKVVFANDHFPSVTAQDVGRELYHGRAEFVQVIGNLESLKRIAWIFQRVSDIFTVRLREDSILVHSTRAQIEAIPNLALEKIIDEIVPSGDEQRRFCEWPDQRVSSNKLKDAHMVEEELIL